MKIQKWDRISKNIKWRKLTISKNGGGEMVIQLNNYRNNIDPSIKLSIIDMMFDKEKRQAVYAQYDKKYESTEEEDEIYNEMRGMYREED